MAASLVRAESGCRARRRNVRRSSRAGPAAVPETGGGDPARRSTPRLGAVLRPARRGRRGRRGRGAPRARRDHGRHLLAGGRARAARARASPAPAVAAAGRGSARRLLRRRPDRRPRRCELSLAHARGRDAGDVRRGAGAHPRRHADARTCTTRSTSCGCSAPRSSAGPRGGRRRSLATGRSPSTRWCTSLATAFDAPTSPPSSLLVPLALVTENRWTGRPPRARSVQIVLLARASVLTFVPGESSTLTFAPVLLLAWAALRFDLRVACGELALFGDLRDRADRARQRAVRRRRSAPTGSAA